jgi:hypothetical protein
VQCFIFVITATQEVGIWRIVVSGQSKPKIRKNPISTNKLGVVVHIRNPSYAGGIGRRVTV